MSVEVIQNESDKRDYIGDFTQYLNARFRGQDDMEQRLMIHAMDFALANDLRMDVGDDDAITFNAS